MAATTNEPTRRTNIANIGGRKASLSDVEKYFLKALLVDPRVNNNNNNNNNNSSSSSSSSKNNNRPPTQERPIRQPLEHRTNLDGQLQHEIPNQKCKKHLDDSVLFQLPFSTTVKQSQSTPVKHNTQFGRHKKKLLGLWQAYSDGAHPKIMQIANQQHQSTADMTSKIRPSTSPNSQESWNMDTDIASRPSVISISGSLPSDARVQQPEDHDENSSWGEEDGGFLHYDTWEVLEDEYAKEFGFDFTEDAGSISATLGDEDEDCQAHIFKILGTSVHDKSAQPHVLSPPLMDSLLSFVPYTVSTENYWMKFSLIRDGASLYTLKQYLKASPMTLLAIETTKGEVFGSFTSKTWKNHPSFYGTAPAFLWRMRYNRRTPCHSLFEQAQMESEIDVFAYSGLNDLFQICDDHKLAVGGGKLLPDWQEPSKGDRALDDHVLRENTPAAREGISVESLIGGENFGFGIALDANLLEGTTSPCGTFRSPCLTNNLSKGEVFKVANLEVWTFTPCSDTTSAERVEMTKYFMEESIRSSSLVGSANSSTYDPFASSFSSQEEFQQDFYRRLGHNEPDNHPRKDMFQYTANSRRS